MSDMIAGTNETMNVHILIHKLEKEIRLLKEDIRGYQIREDNSNACIAVLKSNPLSGQSEGNREKEALDALEWLAKEENHIQRCSGKYVIRGVFYNGEVSFGEGSTPLLAIQNAMNSQGGAS